MWLNQFSMVDQWFYLVRLCKVRDTQPCLSLAYLGNGFFRSAFQVISLALIFFINPLLSKVISVTMLVTKKAFNDIIKCIIKCICQWYHQMYHQMYLSMISSNVIIVFFFFFLIWGKIDLFPHKLSFTKSLSALKVFHGKVARNFNTVYHLFTMLTMLTFR